MGNDKRPEWGERQLKAMNGIALHTMRAYARLEAARAPYSVIEPYALAIAALLGLDDPIATPKIAPAQMTAPEHVDLAAALALISVTKTNEEIQEEIALKKVQATDKRLGELADDIKHALEHFDERKNDYGVVDLIDGHWLRRGAKCTHLENAALIEGVIVRSTDTSSGNFTTVNRSQIREWLKKVEHAKRRPDQTVRPFASEQTAPTGLQAIGAA